MNCSSQDGKRSPCLCVRLLFSRTSFPRPGCSRQTIRSASTALPSASTALPSASMFNAWKVNDLSLLHEFLNDVSFRGRLPFKSYLSLGLCLANLLSGVNKPMHIFIVWGHVWPRK